MFELICVTNRHLSDDFLSDLKRVVAEKNPDFILLREKDLDESEYENLAGQIIKITRNSDTKLIIHTHFKTALKLGVLNIHFSFDDFKKNLTQIYKFNNIGVSIHSVNEAKKAQRLGATYVMAGHVFATKTHEDKEPRGLEFLVEICESIKIKTYAIGGINFKNLDLIKQTGANGACMMREFLKF